MRKKIFAPLFLLVAFLNSGDAISSKGSEAANNTCWNCFALCCYPSYSKENEIRDVIHDGINWRTRAYVADLYNVIPKSSQPELYAFKEKAAFRRESTGFILGQKYHLADRVIKNVLFLGNPDFVNRYTVDTRDNDINVVDRDLLSAMYDELMNAGQRISQTNKIPNAKQLLDGTWAGAQALNTLVQHFISNQSDHSVFYNPDTKVLALFSLENERPTFGLFVDADKPDHRTILSSSSSSEDS